MNEQAFPVYHDQIDGLARVTSSCGCALVGVHLEPCGNHFDDVFLGKLGWSFTDKYYLYERTKP